MRVAIATYAVRPDQFADDDVLAAILRERKVDVSQPNWDDPDIDWESFDLVVARAQDYTSRLSEFLDWTERVGQRLESPPDVIRWNSDKRYLADLGALGVPVVETTYVAPGESAPPIGGEIVVKPSVSAGARDSGRFSEASAADATALIEAITAGGRTAMVQPYISGVEERGETAIVLIAGELSHVLRKGAILGPDEVAPMRDDELGVAEVMYDPELVVAGEAEQSEIDLAIRTRDAVRERFGVVPLIMRVDMLMGAEGRPVVLELEAIEPNLYFDQVPHGGPRLADAILARANEP